MTSPTIHTEILTLIQRYVERQTIVLTAMQQLSPHLFMRSYSGEWTSEIVDQYRRAMEQVAHIPSSGFWGDNDEWQYSLHGGGCRLVHTVTGEPINWDAPKVERFDKFWFLDYLVWLLANDPTDATVAVLQPIAPRDAASLREFTFTLLEQLYQLGKLSEMDSQNNYTLLQR
jgi:hypothetical protein